MRTSKDIYRLASGQFLAVSQSEQPPKGSKLWQGYDYERQYWVFEGKQDTRTLEELRKTKALEQAKQAAKAGYDATCVLCQYREEHEH